MKLSALFEKLKEKKTVLFLVLGLAGLCMILLTDFLPKSAKPMASEQNAPGIYQAKMQQEIGEVVEKIEGAGDCQVLVTLESGPHYIYATENRKNSNTSTDALTDGKRREEAQNDFQDSYILVRKSDGSEAPILLQECSPSVKGVVVLCGGGNNSIVKQMVTEAVTTAFNISSNQVSVLAKR